MTERAEKSQTDLLWQPRPYQQLVFDARARGLSRFFLGWHRRAGKDVTGLEFTRREMKLRPGTYWHLFPEQRHARKAIWHGTDSTGRSILEQVFPESRRKKTHNAMTMIELEDDCVWQMAGSDHYDLLVGSNVFGVVLSEFALSDPAAWDYIRPILVENGGWALFATTFRGRNHAWQMAQANINNPRWYVDIRDVTGTRRNDGRAVVTLDDIEHERAEGMPDSIVRQEFYCDPAAANELAYYGASVEQAVAA